MDGATSYDPRYLAGVLLFNRGDFFEAHEAWEALWMDGTGPDRGFYQGLIQAAVGLCHFCNGNLRGAVKLYHSARGYLSRYGPRHLGLDLEVFWAQMTRCFAPLLEGPEPNPQTEPDADLFPAISLDPPPESWPDPAEFVEDEEERGGP
jgi:uncharacterized protein